MHARPGSGERVAKLGEDRRAGGSLYPRLGSVAAVVEPDADDLLGVGDGREEFEVGELRSRVSTEGTRGRALPAQCLPQVVEPLLGDQLPQAAAPGLLQRAPSIDHDIAREHPRARTVLRPVGHESHLPAD